MEADFSRVDPATGSVWIDGDKPGMAFAVEALWVFVPEGVVFRLQAFRVLVFLAQRGGGPEGDHR